MDYIEIDKLVPFKQHMFTQYSDDKMNWLVRSIKNVGIIQPIIVRQKGFDGTMEILSGHNRVAAAKRVGLTEVPYVISNCNTEDEAMEIVIGTNFNQRSAKDMKVSELAVSFSKFKECLEKQGKDKDIITELNSLSEVYKTQSDFLPSNTDEQKADEGSFPVGNEEIFSATNQYRYLRIALLTDGLLSRMDEGEISIRAGVEISYVDKNNQQLLDTVLGGGNLKCTENSAKALRKAFCDGKLTSEDNIIDILKGKSSDKRTEKKISVTLKPKVLTQFFDENTDKKEITAQVEKSLNFTQKVIPQIFRDNDVKANDYENVVTEALEYYFTNRK